MQKRHLDMMDIANSQQPVNYAPVAENATFKVLCSIVAHEGLEFENVDINQAFTCALHPGTVYVEQPEGFEEKGKEDWVIILNIAMYGLPESPLLWNGEIDSFLTSQGFSSSIADPCLYTKLEGGSYYYVLVYVDDLALAHHSIDAIKTFKQNLHLKYGIKDLGPIAKLTSYKVVRDREAATIILHHHDYVMELL